MSRYKHMSTMGAETSVIDTAQRRVGVTPDGDDTSCEDLLRASAPLLAAFFERHIGPGQADLDDLVQEALIAVHLHRAHYDRTRPFRGRLFGIARHKMVDYFRSRRTHLQTPLPDDACAMDGFEPKASAGLDIERLLRTQPSEQAHVIRDTQIVGLTSAETASRRGIGESDVRVSVHRGVEAMRQSVGMA